MSPRTNLLEDVSPQVAPQSLMQIQRFIVSEVDPATYLTTLYTTFPQFKNTIWAGHANRMQERTERALLEQVQAQLDAAAEAYASGDTHATKPAELYRRYAKLLRKINISSNDQTIQMLATDILNDLFLAQTLSAGELESPDWIDGYTGEVEAEEPDWKLASLPDLMQRVEMVSPLGDEVYSSALHAKLELGWSQRDLENHLRAQTAFEQVDEEVYYDDRGFVPPTLEKDIQIDYTAFAIATPMLAAFSEWRTETFARMKEKGTSGQTWMACFESHKVNSDAVRELIGAISEIAANYDIITAAAIAMKVMGDYGLTEADLEGIGGYTPEGVYYSLLKYIEEWGDDVLDMLNDGLSSQFPTSDIEAADDATMRELGSLLPEKHHNPMQTRSYVLAFIQAVGTGVTLRQAENAALSAWREAMSPKGAKAYDTAWQASKNMSTAWRSFWQQCGPDIPRPKEHVKAIRGNYAGLVLSSGRVIDWRIAAIKARNGEIEWHPGQADKLKALLAQKGLRNLEILKHV